MPTHALVVVSTLYLHNPAAGNQNPCSLPPPSPSLSHLSLSAVLSFSNPLVLLPWRSVTDTHVNTSSCLESAVLRISNCHLVQVSGAAGSSPFVLSPCVTSGSEALITPHPQPHRPLTPLVSREASSHLWQALFPSAVNHRAYLEKAPSALHHTSCFIALSTNHLVPHCTLGYVLLFFLLPQDAGSVRSGPCPHCQFSPTRPRTVLSTCKCFISVASLDCL